MALPHDAKNVQHLAQGKSIRKTESEKLSVLKNIIKIIQSALLQICANAGNEDRNILRNMLEGTPRKTGISIEFVGQ